MDNTENLLRELINVLGFEIQETRHVKKNADGVEMPWDSSDRYEADYKLTKKRDAKHYNWPAIPFATVIKPHKGAS